MNAQQRRTVRRKLPKVGTLVEVRHPRTGELVANARVLYQKRPFLRTVLVRAEEVGIIRILTNWLQPRVVSRSGAALNGLTSK